MAHRVEFGRACDTDAGRGVALLPGSAFGQHGEGYLHLTFANLLENIELALRRMEAVLRGL